MRIEALFQVGEFGHSLALAHDSVRRLGMSFEHGVHQASGTIEDCIGKNASPIALLQLYPWIKRLQKHREFLIGKLEKEKNEFKGTYIVYLEQRRANGTFSRYHRYQSPSGGESKAKKSYRNSAPRLLRDEIEFS